MSYAWPGNIRELRNVMERAVILSRGEMINLSDLPDKILASPDKLDHSHTLEEMERSPHPGSPRGRTVSQRSRRDAGHQRRDIMA